MHVQEIVLIMVIALTELVIARLDLQEKHALIKHAHQIVIIKDIVLVDLVFVIHNLLDVIVLSLSAQIAALVQEHVLI
jgi:hypothetical protein